jgi:hypothetical protein
MIPLKSSGIENTGHALPLVVGTYEFVNQKEGKRKGCYVIIVDCFNCDEHSIIGPALATPLRGLALTEDQRMQQHLSNSYCQGSGIKAPALQQPLHRECFRRPSRK